MGLLDEPTNHVDVHDVAWLTKYVQELSDKEISSTIVSHDSVFLDNVAQDMVHYEKNRKREEKESKKNKDLDEEEKFDAFGNKIVIKKAAVKIPKAELKKIKKQVAALRKQGQEVYTDEEVEKAGYTID